MTFNTLGLSDSILDAVKEKGYDTPSPIQAQAIPAVLKGQDILAAAQTGTGKTAGFVLPILELLSQTPKQKSQGNQVRALILTPTRELAAQIADNIEMYGKHLPLNSTVVFGGVKINPQMMKLRRGCDILVATPGRLLDLYNQNAVKFNNLEILVLDEADRMLDMGFIHDIRKIMNVLPKKRQNLLFSATFSDDIRSLAKTIVHQPIEISVTPRNTTVKSVKQWIAPVDKSQKTKVLTKLIKDNDWKQVLVFSRTKHGANKITKQLEAQGIRAAAIHGNKSQGARTRALAEFKSGQVRALIATDIAARGIDIDQLPQVVNFDLPNVPEDYVHRIGRTGRAGATGQAVSLVSNDELKQLTDIETLIGQLLERQLISGFEPSKPLPVTTLKAKKKPKKPKQHNNKPRNDHKDGQRSGANRQGQKTPTKGANKSNSNRNKNSNNGTSQNKPNGNTGNSAPKKPRRISRRPV